MLLGPEPAPPAAAPRRPTVPRRTAPHASAHGGRRGHGWHSC
ncbi:hypothetical protein R0J90_00180 [Micrococcus sp. SIMBA_144]